MKIVEEFNFNDYFPSLEEADDQEKLKKISTAIDAAAEKALLNQMDVTSETQLIKKAVTDFSKGNRTCGGFDLDKGILGKLTSFEQMCALSQWIQNRTIHKIYTRAFLTNEERETIPLYIVPPKKGVLPKKGDVSLMHVRLGVARGLKAAPKYNKWATDDPKSSAQHIYIDPLDALEMIRQPNRSGALLLKSTTFTQREIDHTWRYKVYNDSEESIFANEASVELPNQKSPKANDIKEQSAGFNLIKMIADPSLQETDLLENTPCFEEYFQEDDDGYASSDLPRITPLCLTKATSNALSGNTTELDDIMAKLLAVQIGTSTDRTLLQNSGSILYKNGN